MFRQYLKLALRSFQSNRLIFGGSIITIFLGTLCVSLLFMYVINELSMDDFHKREKDIYILTVKDSPEGEWIGVEARGLFLSREDYPELETSITLRKYRKGELRITYGESTFSPEILIADSTFFRIFDFKLRAGDKNTVLSDQFSALITVQFAQKIFGNKDPLGQLIKVGDYDEKIYTIKGIIQDPPSNSSITFDLILPDRTSKHYFSRMGVTLLLAGNNFDKYAFISKIQNLKEGRTMSIVPLGDVYFSKGPAYKYLSVFSRFGDKKNIYVLVVIMAVIMAITILNFTNLQVININTKIKYIGISKISGALRRHLIYQKLFEIVLLISFSALLVTFTFLLILPYFNHLTQVSFTPSPWDLLLLNYTVLAILALVAMIYPLVVILKAPIINCLKNQSYTDNGLLARKPVVIVQFAFTLLLIISSIIVFRQLNLMLNKDLGFASNNIIRTKMFYRLPVFGSKEELSKRRDEQLQSYQYIRNALATNSSVTIFSQGRSPVEPYAMSWKLRDNENEYTTQNMLVVSPSYDKLLELNVIEGRFFDLQIDKSRESKVVINMAAKKYWGIDNIKNSRLLNSSWTTKTGWEIIGVVKDFNYERLSVKPQPLIMVFFEDVDEDFLIKLEKGAALSGLQFVQQLFKQVNPAEPFTYSFLSDEISNLYQQEKQLSAVYALFTVVALLITITGLFTIALYDTQRRIKEIGIRKVNGAKVSEILALLNKDFVKWVAIAFIIATPIAWYAMHKWLENFAYKTELSWWIFALAGALALGIALLTVSWQSWRAATRNPVEALRYE